MKPTLWMTLAMACLTAPAYADPYLYGALGQANGNKVPLKGWW